MRHLLPAILALCVCASALAGNVNLRLGPEGEVLGWLVAGPLPNPADNEFKNCQGFDTDYLIPEGSAQAAEGKAAAPGVNWSLAIADAEKGVDLVKALRPNGSAVAYGFATLTSKEPRDVRLLLGSDDGIKTWWNGVLVHTSHLTRGTKRDEEQIEVRLKAGQNRVRVKVDQHFGGWGFIVRVVNADGSPASDLTETLDVWDGGVTGESLADSLLRATVGKQGSLDVHAAAEYGSLRCNAILWRSWLQEYPETYTALTNAQERWTVRLAAAQDKDADALSAVLRDAVADLEKQYAEAFEAFRTGIQNPKPLMKTNLAKEDYVRVAPGGKYFVHADGRFFTPLGYNHNPDWPQTYESAIGRPEYDPAVTDAFFKHLQECGVNLIRLMLESPAGGFLLEDPIGTFNVEQVAFLDNIVNLARKHDIKLMITPWDTFWMGHTWDRNPYNAKNGGPVGTLVEFITRPEVIEAQKRRLKFMIDRWGNTGTIFAWEILNEADKWWDASGEQTQAWAKEMGDYVREYEKQKWGRNHLICISTGHPIPDGAWGELAYRQPGMDLATTHLYLDAAMWPDEPIGPAIAVRKGVNYALGQIKDSRPYIDGENGPINRWIADEKLDDEVFHHMSWAHLASGGAGSSLRWPYRGPHHLTEGMYQHLGRMSKFVKDVPWAKLIGTPSEIRVPVPEGWVACSTGTSQGALVWVASPKPSEMKLSITWNGPKTVKYRCYDTKSGEWICNGTARPADGDLPILISGERSSVAVVLE